MNGIDMWQVAVAAGSIIVSIVGTTAYIVGHISDLKAELREAVRRLSEQQREITEIWKELKNHGERLIQIETRCKAYHEDAD